MTETLSAKDMEEFKSRVAAAKKAEQDNNILKLTDHKLLQLHEREVVGYTNFTTVFIILLFTIPGLVTIYTLFSSPYDPFWHSTPVVFVTTLTALVALCLACLVLLGIASNRLNKPANNQTIYSAEIKRRISANNSK